MSQPNCLDSLPNEILDAVLTALPTRALLPMTLVCRRFHAAALAVLKLRLLQSAELEHHDLILECYPPSAKLSTPSLICRCHALSLLGPHSSKAPGDWALGDLGEVYSRFHPSYADEWPVGASPLPNPTQDVFLDDAELFAQLCASTSIVERGPRPGLYVAHHDIGDGVVRVWRDWLAGAGARAAAAAAAEEGDGDVLWTDHRKDVGVRFSVCRAAELPAQEGRVLVSSEEPPVEGTLRYEEVLVRTSRVVLAMERSRVEEIVRRGRAVVIASY